MSSIFQLRQGRYRSMIPIAATEWYWRSLTQRVLAVAESIESKSDDELSSLAERCRRQIQRGTCTEQIKVEVFALVREISGRIYGMRHHPVQVRGAIAMSEGCVIEMGTGEGKTLTSLMTITLLALAGRGCHVFTANDYLASRDCDFAKPVLSRFGLRAAVLNDQMLEHERADCYRVDVTYGSEKEFGFDFLRDRLAELEQATPGRRFAPTQSVQQIQNGHACAVIDEADCILIDQASTPLVISCPQPISEDDLELFQWCERFADALNATSDYVLNPRVKSARLTHIGCRKVRLASLPARLIRLHFESIIQQLEKTLAARHFFREHQEYLVVDGKLEIIDQGTGRVLPGRKWSDGLHQAVETHAGLGLSDSSGSAARILLQTYVQKYEFACGMTGTATEAQSEFRNIYQLRVASIPSHQPSKLLRLPTRVFSNRLQKLAAIVDEVGRVVASGRAALVGTTSIESSEVCASQLRDKGLDVRVLHAMHHQEEAEIVRLAGEPGCITVATNMAGRGTDIRLHHATRDAGGLYVALAEMNRSARIDRQLSGRAARQGDPGSCQTFVSLEDDLLAVLGPRKVEQLRRRAEHSCEGELSSKSWLPYFVNAQNQIERRSALDRSNLMLAEKKRRTELSPLGLDPYVEFPSGE